MAKKLTIDVVDGSVVINGEIVLDRNGWEVSSIDELNVSINHPQSGFYSSNRVGDIEVGGQTYEDYEALAYVLASTLNEEIGGDVSVEVGSGLHLGSGGEIKLGLDPSTLGTTNKGILTEDLFLILGNIFAQQYSSLQIRQDSFEIMSVIDQFNYGSLFYNSFGDNRLSLTRESGSYPNIRIQSIDFDDSGMYVQDFGAKKGLEYSDDYSANGSTSDRWIPDWGAVKTYVDENAGNPLTFENGLTEEDVVVKLGGEVTESFSLETQGLDYNGFFGMHFDSDYANVGFSTSSDTGLNPYVNFQSYIGPIDENFTALAAIQVGNDNGAYELMMSTEDGFIITDDFNGRGVEYAEDYSANFTDHSLVTKKYVDENDAANLGQLNLSLENKVDKEVGKGLSEDNFTTEEKTKLAGLESPKFKGQFLSLADLNSADVGEVGGYAYVDGGVGGTVDLYIWDAVNSLWELVAGESTAETPASIKSKYESNPDTNTFTDDFKSKLESMTSIFTTALKTAYDNAVSWISTNGVNLLNHLSNKSNPHEVTASQVGLGNVDNTRDIDKPLSTATKNYVDNTVNKVWMPDYGNMEATNRITSSGGTWTSDRKGFVYVLSRGYNSGIYNTQVAFINEKEVGRVWVEATAGSGTARSGSFANIYPVKAGDVIKLYGNLEVKCLFIPGIWV